LAQVLPAATVAAAGIPAKGSRSRRPAREDADGGVGDQSHAVVLASVEHHLREHGEVSGGAEEARVPGDAAKRECILVVHFAAQWITTGRTDLRRGDAIEKGIRGAEEGLGHAERGPYALGQEPVWRRT